MMKKTFSMCALVVLVLSQIVVAVEPIVEEIAVLTGIISEGGGGW
jgi:hypothetical protein